ncbi:metallophosphoesterase [Novosphingobium pentaromativorans]|uniref:Metallophosphoesterase n=1 Tax=Novosphingobium pentaromativorans US6-1 TaxID=1088721 RepID=G6E8M2_9SPHN|nr:metallophosphoesterase [Novosphingobium pentaromativorans]AIT81292.1 serine/threonine protein phosphatase [Novosphingobium pentaromativorans US6-1]EHJ62096.1 metallophosphoesterase [Novosphingobium pentaromativorans US6-1]
MFTKIRTMLGRHKTARIPSLDSGDRVYAIGDIHGRIDLFNSLIEAIEQDDGARGHANTTVILLGDLIDRGPDSAAVVARAKEWAKSRQLEFIKGNHEEMLIASMSNPDVLRSFLKFGGRETIMSYGIDETFIDEAQPDELQKRMIETIPHDDIEFLDSFTKLIRNGDYLFVHAGIRPQTPLDHQLGRDCRWIREPFLSHNGDFGAFVIHGHTIAEEPQVRSNRIGIDTGAFVFGTLTAIGIEGTERWFIQAREDEAGAIATFAAAA